MAYKHEFYFEKNIFPDLNPNYQLKVFRCDNILQSILYLSNKQKF